MNRKLLLMESKVLSLILGTFLVIGIVLGNLKPANAEISSCTALLDPSQEVPAANSDGTGSAAITFDSSNNQLSWSIQFSGLSGPATGAHFHGPALGGANAGVQVNIGDISGLDSPMNGSALLTPEQATSLLDGRMYINIHTEANPNGEIRGQVSCEQSEEGFLDSFNLEACDLSPNGSNGYFFLEPGYKLTLEGQEDGAAIQLIVTVLDETETVDGVETRVVEERESEDGELIEVSRNFFAICTQTNDVFYFGEEVDLYEGGQVVGSEGAWLAGEGDNRPGLIVPAEPKVGMKYYQEVAPGVAEDRAEIISLDEVVVTPAGTFDHVLKVEETNPLESGEREYKYHAPGIGLIQDAELKLVKYELPEVEEPIGELKPQVQLVIVEGDTIEVALNSSSTVSEFELDEENKRVTFKVDGETGTTGRTEISVGRILEGPYTVTIDGESASDFEVIQGGMSGETIVKISYTHSTRDVAIAGTNVVPEFPFSTIGVIAATLGGLILLTRGRLGRNFMQRK